MHRCLALVLDPLHGRYHIPIVCVYSWLILFYSSCQWLCLAALRLEDFWLVARFDGGPTDISRGCVHVALDRNPDQSLLSSIIMYPCHRSIELVIGNCGGPPFLGLVSCQVTSPHKPQTEAMRQCLVLGQQQERPWKNLEATRRPYNVGYRRLNFTSSFSTLPALFFLWKQTACPTTIAPRSRSPAVV